MGFRLRHKSMTLNVNYCSVVSFMRVATKWLKLESHGFHYKVALYHSYMYLPIKFDDDIQESPLIRGSQNWVVWFTTIAIALLNINADKQKYNSSVISEYHLTHHKL